VRLASLHHSHVEFSFLFFSSSSSLLLLLLLLYFYFYFLSTFILSTPGIIRQRGSSRQADSWTGGGKRVVAVVVVDGWSIARKRGSCVSWWVDVIEL
jgi:predicted RNA binding protein YcfA (HicA-like mRNA interferase family)